MTLKLSSLINVRPVRIFGVKHRRILRCVSFEFEAPEDSPVIQTQKDTQTDSLSLTFLYIPPNSSLQIKKLNNVKRISTGRVFYRLSSNYAKVLH